MFAVYASAGNMEMGDVIGPGDLCSRAATLKGFFCTNLGGTLLKGLESLDDGVFL